MTEPPTGPGPDDKFGAAAATTGGPAQRPLDSVPSSDGSTFYFTAMSDKGFGVFKVPAAGGPSTEVLVGAPFVSPFGISISSDDKTLYVVDTAAGSESGGPDATNAGGALFALPVTGGSASQVMGTADTRPRGLDVVKEGGQDVIYFTGTDPANGQAAVFRIPASGGGLSKLATADLLNDPSGIVVATNGDIYVVNVLSPADTTGSIIKLSGGTASLFLAGVGVGYPAGIALSKKEADLLVSGQDKSLGSVVLRINIGSKAVATVNMGLEGSLDSGGLHRARNLNTFSWCGVTAGAEGVVYRVTLF